MQENNNTELDEIEVQIIPEDGPSQPNSETAKPPVADAAAAKPDAAATTDADDDDLDSYGDKVKKRIAKETWKRREEERKRSEAESRAAELERQLDALTRKAQNSDEVAVRATEDKLKVDYDSIQASYKKAYDEGDTDAMFKATEALAEHRMKQKQLDDYKARRAAPQQPAQRPQQQATPQVDPRAMEWASENTWFGKDPVKTGAAYALDAQIKSEGIDPTSNQYYDELNRRLADAFPDLRKPAAQAPQRPQASQPVAGVTRNAQTTGNRRVIQLTPTEVQMADRLGVSYEEYARFKPRSA